MFCVGGSRKWSARNVRERFLRRPSRKFNTKRYRGRRLLRRPSARLIPACKHLLRGLSGWRDSASWRPRRRQKRQGHGGGMPGAARSRNGPPGQRQLESVAADFAQTKTVPQDPQGKKPTPWSRETGKVWVKFSVPFRAEQRTLPDFTRGRQKPEKP